MIGVIITIHPIDSTGDSVDIDYMTAYNNLWLIDYVNEANLSWQGSQGWCYTDKPNSYHTIPKNFNQFAEQSPSALEKMDNGDIQITFYIYCSSSERLSNKAIGFKVKPTNGDMVFSASDRDYNSKVSISALPPEPLDDKALVTKCIFSQKKNPQHDTNNSVYTYTWTMPREFNPDLANIVSDGPTDLSNYYYTDGLNTGNQSTYWMSPGLLFFPGTSEVNRTMKYYCDYSGMDNSTPFTVTTSNREITCLALFGYKYSWIYNDFIGCSRGINITITNMYGTTYKLHFSAASPSQDVTLSTEIVNT